MRRQQTHTTRTYSHANPSSISSCCRVHFPCTIFLKRLPQGLGHLKCVGTTDKTALLHLASVGTCLSCFRCSRNTRSLATVSHHRHTLCISSNLIVQPQPSLSSRLLPVLPSSSFPRHAEQQESSMENTEDKRQEVPPPLFALPPAPPASLALSSPQVCSFNRLSSTSNCKQAIKH